MVNGSSGDVLKGILTVLVSAHGDKHINCRWAQTIDCWPPPDDPVVGPLEGPAHNDRMPVDLVSRPALLKIPLGVFGRRAFELPFRSQVSDAGVQFSLLDEVRRAL